METILTWAGVDDPERLDRASVVLAGDSMRAFGGTHTRGFATSWCLDVGPGWVTRSIHVTAQGPGWWRTLTLARDDGGRWATRVEAAGDPDLPAPGLVDPASVEGALDCDLGLCPVTNTMPIRRLGLLDGGVPPTELVMAWIDVPSLQVLPSTQVYASVDDDVTRRVAFSSDDGDFSVTLTVDDDGLVADYPKLARRLERRG
jgi:hypothetical protein